MTTIEIRDPDYRGFSAGGDKTLFQRSGSAREGRRSVTRLVMTDAPIKAMSLATMERQRNETLHLGTAGGMGPNTLQALPRLLQGIAGNPAARVIATFDEPQGERYSEILEAMTSRAQVVTKWLSSPNPWKDWGRALTRTADARGRT